MSIEQELPTGDQKGFDVWGFINAAKAAVKRELMHGKFNPDNRAGHIGAKAVLDLLHFNGLNAVKMYDSIGILPRFVRYKAPPMGDVCTVAAKVSVHDPATHEHIDDFVFETSWIQDPREKHMVPAVRMTYIENKLYAEAMLVAAQKRAEQIQVNGGASWPTAENLSIREWHELPKNSRPME